MLPGYFLSRSDCHWVCTYSFSHYYESECGSTTVLFLAKDNCWQSNKVFSCPLIADCYYLGNQTTFYEKTKHGQVTQVGETKNITVENNRHKDPVWILHGIIIGWA
jgi:hypothetical protein